MKNILYIIAITCCFSLNSFAQEDDGADFSCITNGTLTSINAWETLCGTNPGSAPINANVIDASMTSISNCSTGGELNFQLEYHTVFSMEFRPDGWPEENGFNLPGSNLGYGNGTGPGFNVANLDAFLGGGISENGTFDVGWYIPLWQTGTAEFNDSYGDGLSCYNNSGDTDGIGWFEIYGPDGVGIGIAAEEANFSQGCDNPFPAIAPLTVDMGTIYQGGTLQMVSDIDGTVATLTSTGAGTLNFGATAVNNSNYAGGISQFNFTVDPTQLTPGLHTFTIDLVGFNEAACDGALPTVTIEILDCDVAVLEDDANGTGANGAIGGAAGNVSDASFDYIEVEGCTPSTGADAGINSAGTDGVIWLKGGGAVTINPGPLCAFDPAAQGGGPGGLGSTWDFGVKVCALDTGVFDHTAAAPGAVPNIAENFGDIDPLLAYVAFDNQCEVVTFDLPQNLSCNTRVYNVYAYQFLYSRDLDCDNLGEYNPDFGPVVFEVHVLPADPISEVITQANVCSGQADPVLVYYGHDINGDGHLEDCPFLDPCTGLQVNEVCHSEVAPAAGNNMTCAQTVEMFDPSPWTAAQQTAVFSAPTDLCYSDIDEAQESYNVNAMQPSFVVVNINATDICSGGTFSYDVETRAANGSVCETRPFTSNYTNTGCAVTSEDLMWEITDAQAQGDVGYVTATALTGSCPHIHNDPVTACVVGEMNMESVNVYPDPSNFVIDVTASAACGQAPIILDSTCPTLTSQAWSAAGPVDGCSTDTDGTNDPVSDSYIWVQTPPAFSATAPAGCVYPNASGSESVNGCDGVGCEPDCDADNGTWVVPPVVPLTSGNGNQ